MNSNYFYSPQFAFAEAVFVEAWHEPFTNESGRADLRVDVTFKKDVPIGTESDSQVSFQLSLKRAEVIVIIPDNGISVDRNTVSREAPTADGRRTETTEKALKASAGSEISGNVLGGISASAKIGADIKQTRSELTEINQNIRLLLVMHSTRLDGHAWEIKPSSGEVLEGKPWDAVREPRLQLIDKRTSSQNQIPPEIIVEVRCRRQDLVISEITLKGEDNKNNFFGKKKNKMAAAEGYIRSQLSRVGLDVNSGSMDDKFLRLILSRIQASCNE